MSTAPHEKAEGALVILDHGSRRPEAHAHLEALASRVRERAPGLLVEVAHLEVRAPTLEDAVARLAASGIRSVAVHPLFLAPGRHLARDIPARLRAAEARHPGLTLRLTEPLGAREELADLILATLREHSQP